MSVSDYAGIFVGLATLYLLWQQNQIFRQQNAIFARQEGTILPASDRAPRFRRYWPMVIMGGLTILTWAAVGYDIYERNHGLETGPSDAPPPMVRLSDKQLRIFNHLQAVEYDWDAFPYEYVVAQQFVNTDVLLDGRDFSNCTFTNVNFVYEGTAPFRFNGQPTLVGNNRVSTDSAVVKSTFNVFFTLGPPVGGAINTPHK